MGKVSIFICAWANHLEILSMGKFICAWAKGIILAWAKVLALFCIRPLEKGISMGPEIHFECDW